MKMQKGKKNEIHFFGPEGPYGFLDPYYPCKIVIDGLSYKSAEHYYQSQKATSVKDRDWIRSAPDAGVSKERAHTLRPDQIVDDWEERKVAVERKGFLEKFGQNRDLAEKLLETGNASIHEDHEGDLFWGSEGKNMVGVLLMEVRKELRNTRKL